MKWFAAIALTLLASGPASARWESATNTGQEGTGDAFIIRCHYRTLAGYEFSTNHRGLCPFTVEVDAEARKVRVPGSGSSSSRPRWDSATNTGQESTGDAFINRCFYETLGGYRFSVNQRGVCPFSVEVDAESGQVRGGGLAGSGGAGSRGRWENATNTGQESTGDAFINRCFYQTLGGYRFSTNHRGLCPYTVEVNPETRQVR